MGTALFLVGLMLIIISILALLGLIQPQGLGERLLIFFGGVLLCLIGYYMARERPAPAE
jgi:hypothetical membrane protein